MAYFIGIVSHGNELMLQIVKETMPENLDNSGDETLSVIVLLCQYACFA